MKESEARTKWCPMVRACGDYEDEHGNNRTKDGHPQSGTLCIGSACMMWNTAWVHENGSSLNPMVPTDEGDCGLKINTI